jgi:glycosyltransferase involved in cell wall biosynthesis
VVTASVITPCYNVARYLPETVESVREQTLTDWEYIIVDDGSTDGSGDIAEDFGALDHRITVVHQANGGAPAARATGYAGCSPNSRYVLWLDGDDTLHPRMLETLATYLDAHEPVGVVICNRQHIDDNGSPIRPSWHPTRWVPGPVFPRRLPASTPDTPFTSLFVQDAVSSTCCTLVRRSVYDRTRGWDIKFGQLFEDWDLLFQLALVAEVHYLPLVLAHQRLGRPGQLTSSASSVRSKELYMKLYDRWSRYEGVPKDKLSEVHEAILFRESRALPMQRLLWGNENMRARKFVAGASLYAQAVLYLTRYLRKRLSGAYDRQLRAALRSS